MKQPKGKRLYRDLALIAGLLVLAAVLAVWLRLGRTAGTQVVVRVDGQDVARYSLAVEGTYELNGGTNTLVIQGGKAFLTHADCPDQLCVKQGKISVAGQVITCLPNRLTVTVYGGDGGVDIVSY